MITNVKKEIQFKSVNINSYSGSSKVTQNWYLWKLYMKSRGYKQTK